jgi:polyhydroxybutyrate depolymerase
MRNQGLILTPLVIILSIILMACSDINQGSSSTSAPTRADANPPGRATATVLPASQATTVVEATSVPPTIVDPETALLSSGNYTRSLLVDGLERSYIVYVPQGYDGTTAYPVVLLLHGGGSNATFWAEVSNLNETANREEFIAVYPNGTGETIEGVGVFTWNGGPRQPYGTDPDIARVDDVGFISALLDDLASVVQVDAKRIYVSGMSAGAIMTYRLACELSDRIAAIAPVAGPMGMETCTPTRPVSVMHFHGTSDQAVPFSGGKGSIDPSGTEYYSVDHAIQAWVGTNGTTTEPTEETLPDNADDGTRVTRYTYSNGRDGSEVVLLSIEGGGHTWPGRDFPPEWAALGRATKDISANDMMWEFFKQHPMQ